MASLKKNIFEYGDGDAVFSLRVLYLQIKD